MERLTREQIRESIILDLEKAFNYKDEKTYWLEKLPMLEEWDEVVHDFITLFESDIRNRDIENFDFHIGELVDHYYVNQEEYDFD